MDEQKQNRSEPEDVGEARMQVERNRERLSETLDALEDRLIETKSAIRDRVNVLRPVQERVRSRPWVAVAVAAGVGAAMGAVLGGSSGPDLIDEDERRRRREWRKRRRLRMQGRDSDSYEGTIRDRVQPPRRSKKSRKASSRSGMGSLRKQLMGTITSAVIAGLKERAKHTANGTSPGRDGRRNAGVPREGGWSTEHERDTSYAAR